MIGCFYKIKWRCFVVVHPCCLAFVLLFVVQFWIQIFEFEFELNLFVGFEKRKRKTFSAQHRPSLLPISLFFSSAQTGPTTPFPGPSRALLSLSPAPADRRVPPVLFLRPERDSSTGPRTTRRSLPWLARRGPSGPINSIAPCKDHRGVRP